MTSDCWGRVLLIGVCLAGGALAQTPREVEVRGGLDETGQWFRWKLTNNSGSPLIELDIPQYQGDMLRLPPEWAYRWVEAGTPDARDGSARVIATAKAPVNAILPGATADIELRVKRGGTQTSQATLYAKFEDGREVAVPGVQVPRGPSAGEKYGTLIGYALVVLIIACAAAWNRRRGGGASSPEAAVGAGMETQES